MLGAVERVEPGRLEVRLAGAKVPGAGHAVFVSMADHAAVDHGYATTIPDAPGATVDRTHVLASGTVDRRLTYVAMAWRRAARDRSAGPDVEPARKRGMFDGLTLNPRRPEVGRPEALPLPRRDRVAPASRQPLARAAERHARALDGAERMVRRAASAAAPGDQGARRPGAAGSGASEAGIARRAARALEAVPPEATRDLHNALRHEPAHGEAPRRLAARMKAKAGPLWRDPQLESPVRPRAPALGAERGSPLARVMRRRAPRKP